MGERTRATRERPGSTAGGPAPTTGPARAAAPDRDALAAGDVDETAAAYGNQAGAARTGPIAGQVPSMLELAEIGGAFQLPAGRDLTDNWNQVTTGRGSSVWITMSSSSLRVEMWPPMVVDMQWPLSNVEWSGFTYDFRSGGVSNVQVRNSQTLAIGAKSFVDGAVRDFVNQMVAGTPVARRGYDPLRDPNPQRTLQLLYANLGGGGGGEVGAEDITDISPSVTVRTRSEIVHGDENGAIRIPAGTTLEVSVGLAGTAADLQRGGVQRVDWVRLATNGIELSQGGEPVARLKQLRLEHGGAVELEQFEPLGKVREYGRTESGVRALVALLQLAAAARGVNPGPISTNTNPDLVNGVAENQIERALGSAVRSVIDEHHSALPGIDLRQVLGVGSR